MARLGVITDGISRDFEHALTVMKRGRAGKRGTTVPLGQGGRRLEVTLNWSLVQRLVEQYEVNVSCISRHNFGGLLVGQTEIGDEVHTRHMQALKRCIDMAKTLDCDLVRIMSFRREMILFGSDGAENWIVSRVPGTSFSSCCPRRCSWPKTSKSRSCWKPATTR